MRNFFTNLTFLLFFLPFLTAQSPNIAPDVSWGKVVGGTGNESINAFVQTPDGGVLLGITTRSPISGNKTVALKGLQDCWLVRLDAAGDILWQKSFGGDGYDAVHAMTATTDGGFLLGATSDSDISTDKSEDSYGGSDFWLIKIDANGNKLWDKTIGGSDEDHLLSIIQTSDNNYVFGGRSESSISGLKTSGNYGSYDYWFVKMNENLEIIWQQNYGGVHFDELFSLSETNDGGFVLGGTSYSGASGNKTTPGYGFSDYWILRTDATGNVIWQKDFGGYDEEYFHELSATTDGGFIIAGYSASPISGNKTDSLMGYGDAWVVKIDGNGDIEWDNALGGDGYDEGTSIVQTSDGGYAMVGDSESGISGDKTEETTNEADFWVVKLDANGFVQWDKTIGESRENIYPKIRETADNGYFVIGSSGDDNADPDPWEYGWRDVWTVRLEGCVPTSSNQEVTVVAPYIDPNGTVYETEGVHTYTVSNSNGCDSIVTLQLSFYPTYDVFLWEYFCDEITIINGITLTGDTTFVDTYQTIHGADSIVTRQYIHMASSASNISATTCGSYTLSDGTVLTQSGLYEELYSNAAGCDSTVYLDLTIHSEFYAELTAAVCENYITPDGTVITSDTILLETYQSSTGCDSTIMIDVTIAESTTSNISATTCGSYTLPDGTVLTETGLYTGSYTSAMGCDSTVHLELTVVNLSTEIEANGLSLMASEPDAVYQWFDCNNNNSDITGATSRTFEPEESGSYGVRITKWGCEETSTCYSFTTVGVSSNFEKEVNVFPNPTTGNLFIELDEVYSSFSVKVYNTLGQSVFTNEFYDRRSLELTLNGASGFYMVVLETEDGDAAVFKILKE